MTQLVGIPLQNLPECWHEVRHFVEAACTRSNGKYAVADIIRSLGSGDMQLWAAADEEGIVKSIGITEIANYPRTRIARLLCVTGEDSSAIEHHLPEMEAWAVANGCTRLEAIARPGWERVLHKDGFKKTHVILEKVLSKYDPRIDA